MRQQQPKPGIDDRNKTYWLVHQHKVSDWFALLWYFIPFSAMLIKAKNYSYC